MARLRRLAQVFPILVALGSVSCVPSSGQNGPCSPYTGDMPYDEVTPGEDFMTTSGDVRVTRADGTEIVAADDDLHVDGATLDVSVRTPLPTDAGAGAGGDAGAATDAGADVDAAADADAGADAGAAIDAEADGDAGAARPPGYFFLRLVHVAWTAPPVTGEQPVETTFDVWTCPREGEDLIVSSAASFTCVSADGAAHDAAEHVVVDGTYRRTGWDPKSYALAVDAERVHVAVTETHVSTPDEHHVSCY